MKLFLIKVVPELPEEKHQQIEAEVKQLISKARKKLLGEVQTMLAAYNVSRQSDLDLLRREIDRIFLENQEP